ncbi:MAG: riboflavin synthase [Gammaproteobacteria bacterium]|nr:MAG: riboflavin synthase [Gammaproteobacteria bacterium]
MFTGIIEEIGTIHSVAEKEDIHQYRIQVSSKFIDGVQLGDSIAVNGVCLTAYDIEQNSFYVDVSKETQQCTSFGRAIRNNQVNLERAVTPTTRLGGHFVSGHVDGLGVLSTREDNDNETILWISSPVELVKYIAVKGSVCINGVSLTVNKVKDEQLCVTIIPHTLKNTILNAIQTEDLLNIEVDLIARYLENIINNRS